MFKGVTFTLEEGLVFVSLPVLGADADSVAEKPSGGLTSRFDRRPTTTAKAIPKKSIDVCRPQTLIMYCAKGAI